MDFQGSAPRQPYRSGACAINTSGLKSLSLAGPTEWELPVENLLAEANRNWTGAPRSPQRTWAENDGADPDFLYASLNTTAYAALFKESRMKCAGAANFTGNPGEAPPPEL
jgi:hypothetical protein